MKHRPCLHATLVPDVCHHCWLAVNNPRYAVWAGPLPEGVAAKPVVVAAKNPVATAMKERLNCIYAGDKVPGKPCGSDLYACTYDHTICSKIKPCTGADRCCQTCPHFSANAVTFNSVPATPKDYRRFVLKEDGPVVYSHSGDYGDIIYALQAVHDMQAETGRRAEFALVPVRGTRAYMDRPHAENIIPLIEAQEYISKAYWNATHIGVRLDLMTRKFWYVEGKNLQDHYSHVLRLPRAHQQGAWLTVPEQRQEAEVVIARSKRYRGAFPWKRVWKAVHDRAVFIGTKDEHNDFEKEVGQVRYCETKTLLDVACVIAGSRLFIGNQSCPRAIAEGLKHPVVVETGAPNDTLFDRPNAWYSNGNGSFWCEALDAYERDKQGDDSSVTVQPVRHKVLCGPRNRRGGGGRLPIAIL